jgi:hypothetical protein
MELLLDTSNLKNSTLGYYVVGNVIHRSKTQALIDGTLRNIHPEWRFNNDVFDRYDWSIEPSESLSELYLERCRQLREKYDYLILSYSAGSDSQLILETCLKNNIRIDEIITVHPLGLSNVVPAEYNNFSSPLNIMAEWDLNVRPKLEWIAQHHPEIKITLHDWSQNINKIKLQDDYVLDRNHNISPFYEHRCDWTTIPSVQDCLAKYDRVGVVVGIDKPRVCYHEGAYRLYFLDLLTAGMGPQVVGSKKDHPLKTEFFFWNPECCKILAKQAHCLVRYFESTPSFKKYIKWPVLNPQWRAWYDVSVRAVIYPEMDLDFFQAAKMNNMTFGFDALLFDIDGMKDKIVNIQKDNISYMQRVVDKKFWNDIDGLPVLVGFPTGMYPVKFVEEKII